MLILKFRVRTVEREVAGPTFGKWLPIVCLLREIRHKAA